MRIAIVLGTRPEIIKFSPIIRELERRRSDYSIVHTNQHYSYEMDKVFFEQLGLPQPGHNLNVGSGTHGRQTGRMLERIEKVISRDGPDVLLVEGDTNTVLAGALCAAKLHVTLGHVEAGLRSFDKRMPEEINRIVADQLSDHLFAPTEESMKNLLREGIPGERVFVTGNTIVDAVKQNLRIANARVRLTSLGVKKGKYGILTLHRQENVDDRSRLKGIMDGLARTVERSGLDVLFPVHPRVRKMLSMFRIRMPDGIKAIDPLGYFEFLRLEAGARIILTDSGGVQEEACILKVPCVTIRENTERPETVRVGANLVAGIRSERIGAAVSKMLDAKRTWANPYGDGMSGMRILNIIESKMRN